MTPIHTGKTTRRHCGAGRLMNEAVFIGTHPGLTPAMLQCMADAPIAALLRSDTTPYYPATHHE